MASVVEGIMENNVEKPKKQFLNYINVFRGLAILLIIMGHTMQFGNSSSLVRIINCEAVCGGTTLFIFISGFLFQHLSYKFEYKNYLSKKWTNVVFPYIVTAIPGLVFCFYFPAAYKNSFDGLNAALQIPVLLSVGRVHNVPTWFIPMIILFFFCSRGLLKLEKKNILYKLLPIFFVITVLLQRGDIEYETVKNMGYFDKYILYVKYVLTGFIHFFSLYVFGMYCSKNKGIIDKFYDKRFLLWAAMILFSILDIYCTYKQIYCNYTISKTILTMLLIGYLKHYDKYILSHDKLNRLLDITAKYSFGLFFIHWYWLFAINMIFNLKNVISSTDNNYAAAMSIVSLRFIAVTILSFLTLYILKSIMLKINKDINTRKYLGV